MARNANLSVLIMEIDCKGVLDLLNNTKGNRTSISWVITEIQDKKKKEFKKSDMSLELVMFVPIS